MNHQVVELSGSYATRVQAAARAQNGCHFGSSKSSVRFSRSATLLAVETRTFLDGEMNVGLTIATLSQTVARQAHHLTALPRPVLLLYIVTPCSPTVVNNAWPELSPIH